VLKESLTWSQLMKILHTIKAEIEGDISSIEVHHSLYDRVSFILSLEYSIFASE